MGTELIRLTGYFLVLTILLQAHSVSLQACNGTRYLFALKGQDKILTSPGYPILYPNNLDCTWIISAPSGQYVKITFTTFDTETNYDHVEIRDGQYSYSRLLAKYSGTKSTFSFVSTGTKLRIRFRTDISGKRRGYRASYRAFDTRPTTLPNVWPTTRYYHNTCIGTRWLNVYSGLRYILKSPGYPFQYPNNMDCTWIISAPAGYHAKITFTTFRTESMSDYIEIRDGQESYSSILAKYSGTKSRFSFVSTGRKLRIRFVTDGSVTNQGFYASYEAVDTPYYTVYPTPYPWFTTPSSNKCLGGVMSLRAKSGYFGYNANAVHVTCKWLIVVPSSYKVRLQIETLNLGSCRASCTSYDNCGSVSVYDGPSPYVKSLGVYCASKKPPPIYAEGHVMLVVFKTSYYYGVLKASYESVRLTPKEEKLTIALSTVGAAFVFTLIISLCCCCKRKELRVRQHTSPPTFIGEQPAGVVFQPQRVELTSLPEENEVSAPAPSGRTHAEETGSWVSAPSAPQFNIPNEPPPPYQQSAGYV